MARLLAVAAVAALAAAQHSLSAKEQTLINEFMATYEKNYKEIEQSTDAAARDLKDLFEKNPKFLAPPEITHRTKAPNSLRDKLVYRATNEKEYNSLDDIKADIVDIMGMRITCFEPHSDLEVIEGTLNKTFTMTKWIRGNPDGNYPGNNYRALHKGHAVEIQTRGALDHAFLQIDHKIAYKPKKSAEMTPAQRDVFNKFHDAIKTASKLLKELMTSYDHDHPRFREMVAEEAEFGDHDSAWKSVTYASEEDLFESVSAYFDAQDRMEQAAQHIHAARRAANRLRTN